MYNNILLPYLQAMYVLFEHASGFGLFSVKEFEEISMLQSQVEKNVTEFGKFAGLIKLHAFSPFKSGANALDNMNCISEGKHDLTNCFFFELSNFSNLKFRVANSCFLPCRLKIVSPLAHKYCMQEFIKLTLLSSVIYVV